MSIKAKKKYYNLPFGVYSGLLLEERVAKKVAKLLYRQNQELQELLQANVDSVEFANWTLAYPNGEQESIYYTAETWQTKEQRIAVVKKTIEIRHERHVYIGTAEEAIAEHMRLYDEKTEVVPET